MSCLLTGGYTIGCRSVSGIQKVFIGLWNDTAMGFTYDVNNQITALTGATVSFYTFQQPIETASFTAPAEASIENNAIQYNQTLLITVHSLNASLLGQIKTLGQGVWRIVILDKNGNYFFMGVQGPVQVSAIEAGLGKAGADLNGATITFTSKEVQPLYQISGTASGLVIV